MAKCGVCGEEVSADRKICDTCYYTLNFLVLYEGSNGDLMGGEESLNQPLGRS